MARNVEERVYSVGNRTMTVRVLDAVGPEDVYENAIHAVLHKYKTGEDLLQPVQRDVKDFIVRSNLQI